MFYTEAGWSRCGIVARLLFSHLFCCDRVAKPRGTRSLLVQTNSHCNHDLCNEVTQQRLRVCTQQRRCQVAAYYIHAVEIRVTSSIVSRVAQTVELAWRFMALAFRYALQACSVKLHRRCIMLLSSCCVVAKSVALCPEFDSCMHSDVETGVSSVSWQDSHSIIWFGCAQALRSCTF